MIEVRALTKTFDGFPALDNLDLTVPRGAVYGLVGPNGAGKSTLIRHLTGVYRPDRGTVTVDGRPVYENPSVKARMAYIPDDVYYYNSANLRDMMKLYTGFYPGFDRGLYRKLREAFGLEEKLAIRRYSKGMQKQAAFLLCLCTRPDYLILDEPVDGLDPVMRRQVWSLILQDVAERGTTVLVSSHNLRELEDVCDHVGIMHKGKMMLERDLSQLQDNVMKVQVVYSEADRTPDLEIIHETVSGRVHTLIVRGSRETVEARMEALRPVFYDLIPLTLEEVFIYELGGVDYEVKNVIL